MKFGNILKTITMVGALLFAFTGCSDSVDDSNLYVFKGEMVSSFLTNNSDRFSDYISLAKRTKLSKKTQSTVMELLATRGNYTVFAPTNEAVQVFVDSIMDQKNFPIDQVSDSIAEMVVKNSIIDTDQNKAYEQSDFNEGALPYQNLNDRYVTVSYDTINGKAVVVINSESRIVEPDNECENGYVHVMDKVVAMSNDEISQLISQADNCKIFSRLLQETGWAKKLNKYRDEDYEENHPEYGNAIGSTGGNVAQYKCPEHRYFGYTAFVEPDSVYEKEWGIKIQVSNFGQIENWDEVKKSIEEHCNQVDIYRQTANEAGNPEDWTNQDNVVNQFVAYHLYEDQIPFDLLVIHMNEWGYSFKNPNKLAANVTRNYESMGPQRRLFRITEGESTDGKRLNRWSSYDEDTYDEITVHDQGALVTSNNGNNSNNALNGFYYPIDRIIVYDSHVRDYVLNDRLRFDLTDYMIESGANGFGNPHRSLDFFNLPNGYLRKVYKITDESWQIVFNEVNPNSWVDVNSNEILILGQYDVTFQLPPVPVDGTYEFRWGLSNASWRGMTQIYFGDNPDNLSAIGVPLDMRAEYTSPNIGWEKDNPDDPHSAKENDKAMRNHGYMKGPKLYGLLSASGVSTSFRDGNGSSMLSMRCIVYRGLMKADKTYYVRFKNVLTNPFGQLFCDYLELVPRSIYNGEKAESIW